MQAVRENSLATLDPSLALLAQAAEHEPDAAIATREPILPDRAIELPGNLFADDVLASHDSLLVALLDGLALPQDRFASFTPDLAHRVGATLREAMEGTFGLLQAQYRAGQPASDGKSAVPRPDDPPLLGCATASEALLQLLEPAGSDAAAQAQTALRRAYDDLQAAMVRAARLNTR